MQATLRLFAALVPDAPSADALQAAAEAMSGRLPPHRVIPAAQLHMTLAFIGDTRVKELREVKESVDRSCAGLDPFTLTARQIVTIPTPENGGPPRLIAAVTDAPPTLLEVQRRLAQRLTKPKKNGRRSRFLPHLTLARYRHGETSDPHDVQLAAPVSWLAEAVTLYASTLTAGGSIYSEVHRAALK
ncbi:MAG TPA: RNA 2',3'-cyclic phosphodiesterase [Phycisphaerales bacterium]|nr:RNA 2',3'-cyclic phosphodiesterase [Phycisphaerales bacterium]